MTWQAWFLVAGAVCFLLSLVVLAVSGWLIYRAGEGLSAYEADLARRYAEEERQ